MKRPPWAIDALDRLYSSPEGRAALQAVTEQADPGWTARVDELVAAIRDRLPGFDQVQWGQLPGWIRLQMLDTWLLFVEGRATTCRHMPVVSRPEPVAAALWRPGVVSCPDCAEFVLRVASQEADATCDGCGHVCAGPAAGDPIHPCALQFGPLALFWGACRDCRPPGPVAPAPFRMSQLKGVHRGKGRR